MGLFFSSFRCSSILIINLRFLDIQQRSCYDLVDRKLILSILKGVLMKPLATMIQSKKPIVNEEKDDDLIQLSFDKDRFTASNPLVMKGIYNTIEKGRMIAGGYFEDKGRVLLVQDNYLFVAVIDSNSHKVKKRLKRQEEWNWKKIRQTLQTLEDKSNDELAQYEDVKFTIFQLEDLVGKEIPPFNLDFANRLVSLDFNKTVQSKLKMESYRIFLEIGKLLKNADPADSFYEDLKSNYNKTRESYRKAAVQYLEELHRFQKEFRQQEHLKILSLVQE